MKQLKGYENKRKLKVTAKEDRFHDEHNKVTMTYHEDLSRNIRKFERLFKDCDDLVKRKFPIGVERKIWAYIAYIDVMIDRRVIEESVLEQLIVYDRSTPPTPENIKVSIFEFLKDGGLATADIKEVEKMDDMTLAVLSGDTLLMIDGYDKAIIISTKGYPNRGVPTTETESVVRGPKDAFSEAFRFNTVLIRRRIRDTKLKVKQMQLGNRSRTDVALMYMSDIVRKEVLEEVERRLDSFEIDAIFETGTIEQLIEHEWFSPFPQANFTERPDKAASAILEGRIVIVVDNTPFVLIVPATISTFFQASEDYYNRWIISSFVRLLRYVACTIAMGLPGFFIALTTYHPSMIPTQLAFSIAASRQGVPFPVVLEVIVMEIAFELLREAGVRLPSAIGSTIGIVGGLIIGQAAVEANIISPIIVIVVALTAISSFAIPNQSLVAGIRLTKFMIIAFSAVFGLYGFIVAILILLIHLSSTKSFGIPYLAPYVAREVNKEEAAKDALVRLPIFALRFRAFYARPEESIRMHTYREHEHEKVKQDAEQGDEE